MSYRIIIRNGSDLFLACKDVRHLHHVDNAIERMKRDIVEAKLAPMFDLSARVIDLQDEQRPAMGSNQDRLEQDLKKFRVDPHRPEDVTTFKTPSELDIGRLDFIRQFAIASKTPFTYLAPDETDRASRAQRVTGPVTGERFYYCHVVSSTGRRLAFFARTLTELDAKVWGAAKSGL